MNPDVDAFLDEKAHPLRAEIDHLRTLLLAPDPEGASLTDPHGLLKGEAAHVRTVKFTSTAELDAAGEALTQLVAAFCAANA